MLTVISRRGRILFAVLMVLCLAMPLLGQEVHAATEGKVKYAKKATVVLYKRFPSYYRITGMGSKGKIKSMKSSKRAVIAVSRDVPGRFKAKSAGKATLTIKTRKNGKIKKYKCTVTVKKYKNPIKSFKFAGTELAGRYKSITDAEYVFTGRRAALKITPRSGWVLKNLRLEYEGEDDEEDSGTISIKNGSTVTLKDLRFYDQTICFSMYNKKDKTTVPLWLEIEED